MNRCVRPNSSFFPSFFAGIAHGSAYSPARRRLAVAGIAALAALIALAVPVHAGLRVFPMDTQRGRIVFTNPPQVKLDGKTAQISPGTRIHDAQSNRLVFASTLKGQKYTVNYVRDGTGTLREIWILTPDEIKEKLPPTQAELNRTRQSQNIAPPQSLN
ncbi:MAG: hypothetical protein LBH10_04030 [Burkholderiaceae bacterium]|jgi:hypothetical protein|nr:hypothetical protein [Burkholderiaceae bacterium]